MPQFFITSAEIRDGRYRIQGEDFRHLVTVRRARPGDTVRLRDETGASRAGRIETIADSYIEVALQGAPERAPRELPELVLCASILKGKNFDLVIEKAVEIGVSRIIPVVSERTIPHPDDEAAKLARWNRKAAEAAKQSLRERIPAVESISRFRDLIAGAAGGTRIIAHPGAGASLREVLAGAAARPVYLLIGPEGGFSPAEIEQAADAGWTEMNFGSSHMRAETAALVLCGVMLYELGS